MVRRTLARPAGVMLIGLAALLAGCHRSAETGTVRIEISTLAQGRPFTPGDGTTLAAGPGQTFTLDRLRYYLSNVRLRRGDGQWFLPPARTDDRGYHLIDARDPASQHFAVADVPYGRYTGLELLLGVDEARQHAGAQTGALDPAHGLFWTWHTGYIFLQVEGHSPQSREASHRLVFHVGGEPTLTRTIFLPLAPKAAEVSTRLEPLIHLSADVTALFSQPQAIDFATLSTAMGGPESAPVADNAAAMFRVDHLHHEPPTRVP